MSSGSGFLLADDIVVTNKRVVESELIDALEIHFPSAGMDGGPYKARLLYKDRDRDLAVLHVETKLKPVALNKDYKFRHGQKQFWQSAVRVLSRVMFCDNAISNGFMAAKKRSKINLISDEHIDQSR